MSKPMHLNEGYMVHAHVRELDFLKRLSIIDGEIFYNTGAIMHRVKDRIDMYEDKINEDPDAYEEELERLNASKYRQAEHLRTL